MEATAERACLACVLPQGAAELPEVAVAVHARYSPPLRTLGLDCLVGDVDGKQLFRCVRGARAWPGGMYMVEAPSVQAPFWHVLGAERLTGVCRTCLEAALCG